jgi:hypothetical protein
MYLMQILLPLTSPRGEKFPRAHYEHTEKQLISHFKGFTAYPRAPASGLWKNADATLERDDLIVYEVLAQQSDAEWWAAFRKSLETLFEQDTILIMSHEVTIM